MMQEAPIPLALLLGQLTDLGGAVIMQGQQPGAAALSQPKRNAPALTLSLVIAVTPPASTIARPVAAPSPANDNAEG